MKKEVAVCAPMLRSELTSLLTYLHTSPILTYSLTYLLYLLLLTLLALLTYFTYLVTYLLT